MEPNPPETPAAILDALRDHPEWTDRQREEAFDRLITRFELEELVAAVHDRLDDLRGEQGSIIIRLVDALGAPELFEALATALHAQPNLPPERAWEALSVLDEVGLIEAVPELNERWEELNETLGDEENCLGQLVGQIEDDPEECWVALQGLAAIEPEVRGQILAGLARQPMGPGLVEFLRLLSFAHEPTTRSAALEALARQRGDDPRVVEAWARIAADHPDAQIVARAQCWLGQTVQATALEEGGSRPSPRPRRSLVTALDGQGRGYIALAAEDRERHVAAVFLGDVEAGIAGVTGQIGNLEAGADAVLDELAERPDLDVIEGSPELAFGLLAGCLLLCGPATTPALRFWLERTAGPSLRPAPFPDAFEGWDPSSLPIEELPDRARAVLGACRDWHDDSALTYDLAEELLLREGDAPPDPIRDAGALRFLFEHRLRDRLETYRRMLLWMAAFWQSSGALDLGESAYALAWQLSDPQHAVPGHPFAQALACQSLAVAQDNLRRGIDLRHRSCS
jgi:hypothetical protein